MSKRKYHEAIETEDLNAAVRHISRAAHADVRIVLRAPVNSEAALVVQVEFRAPGMPPEADAVHLYQEAIDTRRKVELASVLHRVLNAAWSSYHCSPWQWTGGMRRANVRSEE